MAVQMTNEQLQTLIAALQPGGNQMQQLVNAVNRQPPQKSAAALGHMRPLELGSDKMRKLKIFNEWLEEAENRMKYLGVNTDDEKISLLRAWGNSEIVTFMKLHAKVRFETVPAIGDQPEIPKDNYDQIVTKIRGVLQKMVNRTLAMHELMTTKQGNRTWLEFYTDLETKAQNLDFDTTRYTHKDAVKDALIMGMSDKKLMERALTEDPDHDTLIGWGEAREAGKEGVHHLAGGYSTTNRVEGFDEMSDSEIEDMMEALSVMKVKRQGRYSSRPRRDFRKPSVKCKNCQSEHPPRRCPANGKECFTCGGINHFSNTEACPKTRKSVKRVDHSEELASTYFETATEPEELRMISIVGRVEPNDRSKEVPVKIGGIPLKLFTDTGSDHTIIPPSQYTTAMGEMVKADTKLRAWGSTTLLDVKGMIHTKLQTEKGATTNTKVYVVDGFRPEPLLGDKDAEDLGFVSFNKYGRDPTIEEKEYCSINRNHCIPEKVRQGLNVEVTTKRPNTPEISQECKNKTMALLQTYKGSVLSDNKIGKLQCQPVSLPSNTHFQPTQPPFRNIPIHYQGKVSNLLTFLRENDVIEDVDPKEIHDCVLNTVITEKANGEIRMNIDNTPLNPGMLRTKYHIQTPQEIRHELKEATVFSEMDMGWGYHQIPLDTQTQKKAVFQTHEGLHRMKRLYFGPTAASGIFHNEIRKAFTGLEGITTLHDNILVSGKTEEEHYKNLKSCLDRCKERGITLKPSKSNICQREIQWFGRTFTPYGVGADKKKIDQIKEKGRPNNTEDVRSLLMACQYNAKFAFDNPETPDSYEQITAPLRKLLTRNAKFTWGSLEEEAYQKLMNVMTSETTLRPYNINKTTHFIADASPLGIQASIYQEDENRVWLPVDHVSRALTVTEQKYSPIEKESLAQSWGMNQFRYYLLGSKFQSWTDHKPLLPLYNNRDSTASKRIARHRDQIQDMDYTMKHLPGKENPCDYGSRHPLPIDHLEEAEKTKLGLDIGNEVYVRKIATANSPRAITVEDIKAAASNDPAYTQLIDCIKKGKSGNPIIKEAGYKNIWQELCIIDDTIHKGDKIVIPDGEIFPGSGNIRNWVLDIAHEGHQGCTAMKSYLRSIAWFPKMDSSIDKKVKECLACQASTKTPHRDPLIPSTLPDQPWEKLSADHWGPLPDGKYLLVIVDEFSRYPEVEVVKGTSAEANLPALDSIFARHGFCKRLKTDGGPPFNGNENHSLQQYFQWAGIQHKTTKSAEDPEANGLAEAFMKHCGKIYHTATIERKNPTAELNKHLRMYRATPHPTTGKPPALLLFGRNIKTRIATTDSLRVTKDRQKDISEARIHDAKAKEDQKINKDDKAYVKEHQIRVGDQVLLSQIKSKLKPPYDPKPYQATDIKGHQITATRGNKSLTRDAQKWKKFEPGIPLNYRNIRDQEHQLKMQQEDDSDIDFYMPAKKNNERQPGRNYIAPNQIHRDDPVQQPPPQNDENEESENEEVPPPRLYPQRERRRPDFFVVSQIRDRKFTQRDMRTAQNLKQLQYLLHSYRAKQK